MSNYIDKLTQIKLKEILEYNPETGIFVFVCDFNKYSFGDVAGLSSHGYLRVSIKGLKYRLHRLAFLYMNGKIPNCDVDHINGLKHDNRWSNLRKCTKSQNSMNIKIRSDNKSGYKGVAWHTRAGKWVVTIAINKKNKHLGLFKCKHEAAKIYNDAAVRYFGEFAWLNEIIN